MSLTLADLSKAFECVSYRILLKKLKAYGVKGRVDQMITSYHSERQQVVSIRGAYSSSLPVAQGVPQGSIIGPILFLTMANDIDKLGNMVLFADDTTPYTRENSPVLALKDSVIVFERVKQWFAGNKL